MDDDDSMKLKYRADTDNMIEGMYQTPELKLRFAVFN